MLNIIVREFEQTHHALRVLFLHSATTSPLANQSISPTLQKQRDVATCKSCEELLQVYGAPTTRLTKARMVPKTAKTSVRSFQAQGV